MPEIHFLFDDDYDPLYDAPHTFESRIGLLGPVIFQRPWGMEITKPAQRANDLADLPAMQPEFLVHVLPCEFLQELRARVPYLRENELLAAQDVLRQINDSFPHFSQAAINARSRA